jgi:hypothetical protein
VSFAVLSACLVSLTGAVTEAAGPGGPEARPGPLEPRVREVLERATPSGGDERRIASAQGSRSAEFKSILNNDERMLMIRYYRCDVSRWLGGMYGDTPGIVPAYAGKASDGSSPRMDL